MSGSIRLRAGDKAGMPRLADREPAYVRDEEALYVGTSAGNVKIGGKTESIVAAMAGRVSTMGEILSDHLTAIAGLQETQTAQSRTLAAVETAQQTQGETVARLQQEKLTASHMAAVAELAADADLAAVAAACNSLIAGLKAAGIMK